MRAQLDDTHAAGDLAVAFPVGQLVRDHWVVWGRLDAPTAQALGVAATTEKAEPSPTSGTWRRLRSGDMQFLKKLNAGEIAPPPAPAAASPAPTVARATKTVETRTQTRLAEPPPPPAAPPEGGDVYGKERLRDYV